MADTVTVPRTYLETLLRRAELHDSGASIKISESHYNSLIHDVQQYHNLRAALIAGGTTQETLTYLVNSQSVQTPPTACDEDCDKNDDKSGDERADSSTSASQSQWDESESLFMLKAQRSRYARNNQHTNEENQHTHVKVAKVLPDNSNLPLTPNTVSSDEVVIHSITTPAPVTRHNGNRSIVIENLPSSTSLLDLTKIIRGGVIFNLYMRRHDNSAHLSFVNPEAADSFLAYSQKKGTKINGKLVRMRWDDTQSYIPNYIMSHIIHHEATRNIVLRFPKTNVTAESIRDDLEHIHQLEVISLFFDRGHAWIKLNSIQHAMTAKKCMQSRLVYKGSSRIEFFPDECNVPLNFADTHEEPVIASKRTSTCEFLLKPAIVPFSNRFAALSADVLEENRELDF